MASKLELYDMEQHRLTANAKPFRPDLVYTVDDVKPEVADVIKDMLEGEHPTTLYAVSDVALPMEYVKMAETVPVWSNDRHAIYLYTGTSDGDDHSADRTFTKSMAFLADIITKDPEWVTQFTETDEERATKTLSAWRREFYEFLSKNGTSLSDEEVVSAAMERITARADTRIAKLPLIQQSDSDDAMLDRAYGIQECLITAARKIVSVLRVIDEVYGSSVTFTPARCVGILRDDVSARANREVAAVYAHAVEQHRSPSPMFDARVEMFAKSVIDAYANWLPDTLLTNPRQEPDLGLSLLDFSNEVKHFNPLAYCKVIDALYAKALEVEYQKETVTRSPFAKAVINRAISSLWCDNKDQLVRATVDIVENYVARSIRKSAHISALPPSSYERAVGAAKLRVIATLRATHEFVLPKVSHDYVRAKSDGMASADADELVNDASWPVMQAAAEVVELLNADLMAASHDLTKGIMHNRDRTRFTYVLAELMGSEVTRFNESLRSMDLAGYEDNDVAYERRAITDDD